MGFSCSCPGPLECQQLKTSQVCAWTNFIVKEGLTCYQAMLSCTTAFIAVQLAGRQLQKSWAGRSFCSACICFAMLCQGLVMAPDTCGAASTWLNRLWMVFQILDFLLVLLANAAALHSLFGRHIKGGHPPDTNQVASVLHAHSLPSSVQDPVQSRFLNEWADDLSCALFGLANSVTAMFYLIDATTGKDALVEGGEISRPPWLGFSVHVFNSLTAWADICCAHPRSFSRRAGRLSVGIIAFYTVWILICSHCNGAFPYPILNELPWPAVSATTAPFAL